MDSPTIKECFEYSGNLEQATLFFHYYESQGWRVGKNPMKSWKQALSGWMKRNESKTSKVDQALSNRKTDVADLLWRRMTEIYGHKWVSSYGTEPSKPWVNVIQSLSNEQIKHGLTEMLKMGDNWPPSLTEFNKLCRSARKPFKQKALMNNSKVQELRQRTNNARRESFCRINEILTG